MRRSVGCGMLAGALAAAIFPLARAEDVAERDAQLRFEEGVARVKSGDFEGARMSFTQAYAVLHRPTILWNLALAEEKAGKILMALRHFKEFLRTGPPAEDWAGAEKHIVELMGQTGHLDVTAPAGTQVIVDGTPIGLAPLGGAVDVMPGHHRVEAHTAEGEERGDAEIAAGQLAHVSLRPPLDTAHMTSLPGAPGATGHDQASPSMPPAGTAIVPDGRGTAHASGSSAGRTIAVALMGATAVVSIGLGAYFGVQSQSDATTADGFRGQYSSIYCYQLASANSAVCKQWDDAVQAQRRDATLSTVLYVAGGVLAVGAVTMWLLWPNRSTGVALHLEPIVGVAAAGLHAVGSF